MKLPFTGPAQKIGRTNTAASGSHSGHFKVTDMAARGMDLAKSSPSTLGRLIRPNAEPFRRNISPTGQVGPKAGKNWQADRSQGQGTGNFQRNPTGTENYKRQKDGSTKDRSGPM